MAQKRFGVWLRLLSRIGPVIEALDDELDDGKLDVAGVLRLAPEIVQAVSGKELAEFGPQFAALARFVDRLSRETRDGKLEASTAFELVGDLVESLTGKTLEELGVELPRVEVPDEITKPIEAAEEIRKALPKGKTR